MKRFLVVLFIALVKIGVSQCNPPALLTASSITTNSATISFYGNPPGTVPYQIQYGLTGFQVGSEPIITIPSTTYLLTGLNGATTYDYYVRDTCTNGLVSQWVGPFTFNTLCSGVVQSPMTYTFDAGNWQVSSLFTIPGILDACWNVSPVDTDYTWTVGPQIATQVFTGPNGDHTSGLGQYLHVGNFGLSPQLKTSLVLPKVSLSGLTSPELTFWYHMYGAGIDKLVVLAKSTNASTWDTIQSLVGQQQSSKTDPWLESVISLTQYLNDTVEFQFVGFRTSTGPYVEISIDDLSIQNFQTCPDPTGFQAVSSSDHSVLLDWFSGGATNWQVEYGPSGHVLGTGNLLSATTHPFLISGLASSTSYQFYVRDSCGANDKSNWVGPLRIKTDCLPIYAPHSEDFEDSTWVKPVLFGQFGTISECWKNQHTSNFFWDVGPSLFSSSFSGPSGDHTTGTGKYIFTNRDVYWGLDYASITSPIIDLDTINVPELTFWHHMYGGTIAGLDVAVDSGDGFYNVLVINGQQQTSSTDPWQERIISLPAYAGKKVKIRFKGRSSFAYSNVCNIALDDFSIHETPPCPKPIDIDVSNIKYTQADLNWTTGGASNWIIRYKTNTGLFSYVSTASNPHTLGGLQADTEYEIWIKDSCALNNSSVWNGPLNFRTRCYPILAPYFENFDGGGFVPPAGYLLSGALNSCWQRDFDEGFYWETGPPNFIHVTSGPYQDHTTGGGKYLVSDVMNFVARDTCEMISPEIDLTNLSQPEMAFWYHMFGSGISALQIEIDNGAGWTFLDSIYGAQQFSKTDAWKEQIVDLSNYTGDTVQFRFLSIRAPYNTASEIAIDDLHIYEKPTCTKPAGIVVQNVRSTEARLTWASNANHWIVKYKPSGGAFTFQATSSKNPFLLSSLTPNTRYEIWVRDSCGLNDVGLWVGPKIFKTDCQPTQTPYYESFDSQNWQPVLTTGDRGTISSCWKVTDTTYLSWMPYAGNATNTLTGPIGPRLGAGSGNFMMFNNVIYSLPVLTSELISPAIFITNITLPELNFYYHMYGAQIGKLEVYAQKLDGSRTLIHTLNGQQQTSKIAPWNLQSIPLTGYLNDTVKIVFKGHKAIGYSSTFNIAIDDVEIVDAFCASPYNLSAINPTPNSVELTWMSANVRSNIEYGLSGFSQGQGTVISNVSSPYTLTGLQSSTAYDFYVMDSCRATNSLWVGPFAFNTFCDKPDADFTYTNQVTAIDFDASASTGLIASYFWDFGDGSSGGGVNPVHSYAAPGNYTVTLATTDICGLSDTTSKTISVCTPPVAVINYSANGLVVSFDGTQSTGATSYYWDFGPAGIYISAQPLVAFPAKAVYNIYLAITDSCGGIDTAFLDLNLCDKPKADFSYYIVSSGGSGMTIDFDGTHSQGVQSFEWRFGDGNTNTTSLTPTHTYSVPGLHYQVTLITYGDCGASDTLSYKLQDVVSVKEFDDWELNAYPNPVSDRLQVELSPNTKDISFSWFDMSGKELTAPILSQTQNFFEFDLSEFAAGQYLLFLKSAEKEKTLKVVVE